MRNILLLISFLFSININAQQSQPADFSDCTPNATGCYDLTLNNDNVLFGDEPSAPVTVTYHTNSSDAQLGNNAIPNPTNYCVGDGTNNAVVWARVYSFALNNYSFYYSFDVTAQNTSAGEIITMGFCDDDNDGQAVLNFNDTASELNTTNALSYYLSYADAVSQVNQLTTTSYIYNTGSSFPMTLFVREDVIDSCDFIHKVSALAVPNCTTAATCNTAYTLCSGLNGFSFLFNAPVGGLSAEAGNDYGCLQSTLNPTWIKVPINSSGDLELNIMGRLSLEWLDFFNTETVVYGPFGANTEPCSAGLDNSMIIDCQTGFSSLSIPNVTAGTYYLLMVSNPDGNGGWIDISPAFSNTAGIGCGSGFKLNAFIDLNANGTKDTGESGFGSGHFNYQLNGDPQIYSLSSPEGIIYISDDNSTNVYDLNYTVDAEYAEFFSASTVGFPDISIEAGIITELNFPITVLQPFVDASVSIVAQNAPRPGFSYASEIIFTNYGNQPITSGTVEFHKDALTSIVSISNSSAVMTPTGFYLNFTNLQPLETRSVVVILNVPTIPTINLGDLLTNEVQIEATGNDIGTNNNSNTITQVVVGSYDPNDKMESHGPQIRFDDFNEDDYLYYTIRFENSGSSYAETVAITDILDEGLDLSSFRMINASHNYTLEQENSELTWRFENIMLQPTSLDPEGAQGYVHFKVKPLPGFAIGDILENTASIYFDFNPAIVTNTFATTFVEELSTVDVAINNLKIYPNPAADHVVVTADQEILNVTITDLLGKKVVSQNNNSTAATVDVSDLSNGLYIITVKSNSTTEVKKLIIQ